MTRRDIPELPGMQIPGTKLVRVWCEHCGCWHQHGNPDGEGLLHRLAHCHRPDSPYQGRGYFIRVAEGRGNV